MTKRPRRQKKADRLLAGSNATPVEVQADYALGPLDQLARQMDRKWGIDRLPELVSVETATKYGSILAKLNAAIDNADPAEAARVAQGVMRGLHAMDAEAEKSGAPKANPEVWEIEHQGHKIGIIRDQNYWPELKAQRPDLAIYTLNEVAVALAQLHTDRVAEIKARFPGAEVTAIKTPQAEMPASEITDDEIAF